MFSFYYRVTNHDFKCMDGQQIMLRPHTLLFFSQILGQANLKSWQSPLVLTGGYGKKGERSRWKDDSDKTKNQACAPRPPSLDLQTSPAAAGPLFRLSVRSVVVFPDDRDRRTRPTDCQSAIKPTLPTRSTFPSPFLPSFL